MNSIVKCKKALSKTAIVIMVVVVAIAAVGATYYYISTRPKVEQVLIIGTTSGEVDTLDPAVGVADITYWISTLVFDSLLRWKPPDCTEVMPWLATNYTVSLDAKVFEFTLRKGVKFHDGTPLNATSVKESLERVIELEAPLSFYLADLDRIEVLDTYKLRIYLKNPNIAFLGTSAMGLVGAVVPKAQAEAAGDNWGKTILIGSGPFKFVEWVKGDRIVLERNDDYWGPKPKLDKIIIKIIGDPTTARMMLERGEIDMFYKYPLATDIPVLKDNPDIEWQVCPIGYHRHLFLNQRIPPLNDTRVRQAIAYAINVSRVVEVGYKGEGPISYSFLSTWQKPWYKPVFEKYHCNYTKARELLAEAGYPDGFAIDLYYTPTHWDVMDRDAAMVIKDELAKVGITVTVHEVEWATFLDMMYHDGSLMAMDIDAWVSDSPDPEHGMMMDIHPEYGFDCETLAWNNTRFAELGYLGKATTDLQERIRIYHEAQDILAEDVPIYPIKDSNVYVFYRTWVMNYTLYPNPYMDGYSFAYTYIGQH